MEFCMDESCGKCIPCRAGTVPDARHAQEDQRGHAHARRPRDARRALRHGQAHQPLRPRPDGARTPCSRTLRYFRHEYDGPCSRARLRRRHRAQIQARPRRSTHERPSMPVVNTYRSTARTSAPARTRRSSRSRARTASQSPRSATSTGLTDVGACRLCLVEVAGSPQAPRRPASRSRRRDGRHDQHRAARTSIAR